MAAQSSPAGDSDEASDLDLLRERVGCLPERQRQVIFLRYYADLGYCAIGDALGVATGTVSATLSAAHAALRADDAQEVVR